MPECGRCGAQVSVDAQVCASCGRSFIANNQRPIQESVRPKARQPEIEAETVENVRAGGWVYVMTNKAMPSLAKVGFTTNTPDQRAKELEGTGIPHKFTVEYAALVIDPQQVEGKAHEHLEEHHEGKEWFRCEIEQAVIAIRIAAGRVIREDYRRVDRELIAQELLRRKREASQRAAHEKRIREISEQADAAMRKLRDESHSKMVGIAKIEADQHAQGRLTALKEWEKNASSAGKVLPFTLLGAVICPFNLGLGILYGVLLVICVVISIPIRKSMALSAFEKSDEAEKICAQGRISREREVAVLESAIKGIEAKRALLIERVKS